MPTRSKAAPIAAGSNSPNSPHEIIPKRWFDIAESAIYLVVSQGYVRALIHDRKIQATRLGNTFRIDRVDLDRLLESSKKLQAPYRKNTRPWVAARWSEEREQKQQSRTKKAAR
jgi:excisionase family DNA binding protein